MCPLVCIHVLVHSYHHSFQHQSLRDSQVLVLSLITIMVLEKTVAPEWNQKAQKLRGNKRVSRFVSGVTVSK